MPTSSAIEQHGTQAQGHQQGHQLVGARLNGDVAKQAESSATRAQLQAQSIPQEQGGCVVASLIRVRPGKGGQLDGGELQLRNEGDDVFIRTPQGA